MNLLEVNTGERTGAVCVALRGELDLSTVDKVERALRRGRARLAPADAHRPLRAHLPRLHRAPHDRDRAISAPATRDRRVVVVKGPEIVHRVFTITRLDERLHIVDDAESGVGPDAEA